MEIDSDIARKLFHQGAFVLFLDAPEDIDFGIDYNEWRTGPKFKGLKLIPPGLHFFFYSARSSSGESGVRTGFLKYFEPREIVIKRWNKSIEDVFEDSEMDSDEVARLKYNIQEFDQQLGAYPLIPTNDQPIPTYKKWLKLTTHVSKALVTRVLPLSGKISSITSISRFSDVLLDKKDSGGTSASMDMDPQPSELDKAHSAAGDDDEQLRINFTIVDLKRSFPAGAQGIDLTNFSLDKSYLLRRTIELSYVGSEYIMAFKRNFKERMRPVTSEYKELLGEIQLSFILFLIGQVYDGLEQWKSLVSLICGSYDAITDLGSTLFAEFLDVITSQLDACPDDFFLDAISSESFLRSALVELISNMRDIDAAGNRLPNRALEARANTLVNLLSERFKWDIEEAIREHKLLQEDDEAPVIVDDL